MAIFISVLPAVSPSLLSAASSLPLDASSLLLDAGALSVFPPLPEPHAARENAIVAARNIAIILFFINKFPPVLFQ